MPTLEQQISALQERNKKVEIDKAWETSIFRRFVIIILTYGVIVLVFFIARLPKPFVNAIIPTVGYTLSTLSLPIFKKIWLKYFVKK